MSNYNHDMASHYLITFSARAHWNLFQSKWPKQIKSRPFLILSHSGQGLQLFQISSAEDPDPGMSSGRERAGWNTLPSLRGSWERWWRTKLWSRERLQEDQHTTRGRYRARRSAVGKCYRNCCSGSAREPQHPAAWLVLVYHSYTPPFQTCTLVK